MHDKDHISGKDFHELTTAYEFLRTVEHRLQLRHGQQTHRMPAAGSELRTLARMVRGPDAQPEELLDYLRRRMSAVAAIYGRIIHQQQAQQQRQSPETAARFSADSRDEAHRQLTDRLAVDAPALYRLVRRPDLDPHARRNLYRFLAAASTSPERYAAVSRAPKAVERALQLFAHSEYLTDILVRHPQQIESLAEVTLARSATRVLHSDHAVFPDKIPEEGSIRTSLPGCAASTVPSYLSPGHAT